jgi:hypothetical protein
MQRKENCISEPLEAIRGSAPGRWVKQHGLLPSGQLLRRGWEAIDPLYIWSATAGFFVALVLIVVTAILETRHLH